MAPRNVDEYIQSTPKEEHEKLNLLRKAINQAAPEAEEKISYSMPYYDYKGRLAYFRLAKNHIGLYIPGSVIEQYQNELAQYETHKATIRLPLKEKLPIDLIKKL